LLDKRSISLNGPFIAVALLLVAVVILVGLTRGTSLEEEYAGKRVLRISFEMNLSEINEVWNTVKEEFEALHPDVVIVLIDDINQKASIYEAANKLPDIISTNTFSQHRYKNVILPLDDLVARDRVEHQPDDFYPAIIESCRFAGDLSGAVLQYRRRYYRLVPGLYAGLRLSQYRRGPDQREGGVLLRAQYLRERLSVRALRVGLRPGLDTDGRDPDDDVGTILLEEAMGSRC